MANNKEQLARKAAMVRFINENGGKATMNMRMDKIEGMYKALKKQTDDATKNQDQVKEMGEVVQKNNEERKVSMTLKELRDHIEEAKKPLKEEIDRLRQQIAGQQNAPADESLEVEPEVDADAVRAEYVDAYMECQRLYDEYMDVLRKGQMDMKLREAYMMARKKLQSIEKDATVREYIADFLADTSKVTREYGHRGVNALAKGMHATVDGIANVIDATGEIVRGTSKMSFFKRMKRAQA